MNMFLELLVLGFFGTWIILHDFKYLEIPFAENATLAIMSWVMFMPKLMGLTPNQIAFDLVATIAVMGFAYVMWLFKFQAGGDFKLWFAVIPFGLQNLQIFLMSAIVCNIVGIIFPILSGKVKNFHEVRTTILAYAWVIILPAIIAMVM